MNKPLPENGGEASPQHMEELYQRHFDMVYRISFSYLKNHFDAEDATAEVFAKLMRKNPTFQSAEHEKAWPIRVTVNTCKDALKHWWRGRTELDGNEAVPGRDPFHIDETLQAVLDLPARYKDVMYLYYYEGYKTEEIARILRKPHNTVRGHLREARMLLRGVLEDET